MSQILSTRIPDDLYTKIENRNESKTDTVIEALKQHLEKTDEQKQPQTSISAAEIKELFKLIHALCENLIALESKIEDIDKKLFSVETKLFDDTMAIRDDISKIYDQIYLVITKQNNKEIPKHFV